MAMLEKRPARRARLKKRHRHPKRMSRRWIAGRPDPLPVGRRCPLVWPGHPDRWSAAPRKPARQQRAAPRKVVRCVPRERPVELGWLPSVVERRGAGTESTKVEGPRPCHPERGRQPGPGPAKRPLESTPTEGDHGNAGPWRGKAYSNPCVVGHSVCPRTGSDRMSESRNMPQPVALGRRP